MATIPLPSNPVLLGLTIIGAWTVLSFLLALVVGRALSILSDTT